MPKSSFKLGEDHLTVGHALDMARSKTLAVFSPSTKKKIARSQKCVETLVASGKNVYGVNTGFGPLCTSIISKEDSQKLQQNILRSHSVGMGNPVSTEIARLMLVLKLHNLSLGYSGVRQETLDRILWHLNEDIIPLVPEQGSVGASGDLAPLAHLFLPLIGQGTVEHKGKKFPTGNYLKKVGKKPLELGAKEGLALINGTQFIAAHTVVGLEKLLNVLNTADIISAMSLESLMGSASPFDARLHELRPFEGSKTVAHRMRALLAKSKILASHLDCNRVQDPYSLRCVPQVHGASRDAWLHLNRLCKIELNSVTDNPIILDEETAISGGNFHGQPLAIPLDYAVVASSEIGNISDRRSYLLLEGKVEGLPKLLMRNTGINSGFMIPQYTSAALVSENKSLCFPASADSIPTSLGQEDHVSMGSISGRRLIQVTQNVEKVLAVELVCAAQAFDFRHPLKSGPILEKCHDLIRQHIDHAEEDRIFADDLESALELISSKKLNQCAEKVARDRKLNLDGDLHEHFRLY
ncbi:histidine ammonia-lyase [bacterium]|nr:histidine ammonia-lyase [bacterium]